MSEALLSATDTRMKETAMCSARVSRSRVKGNKQINRIDMAERAERTVQVERMGEDREERWEEFGKACQKIPLYQLSLNFKQQDNGGS